MELPSPQDRLRLSRQRRIQKSLELKLLPNFPIATKVKSRCESILNNASDRPFDNRSLNSSLFFREVLV